VTSAGGRHRFDALFQQHVAGIASYCRWRSCSFADAEDAVAEVFLIAWRRFEDVPIGDDARPWLYATAWRVLANQARANARRRRLNERLSAQPVTTGRAMIHSSLGCRTRSRRSTRTIARCCSWSSGKGSRRRRSPLCCTGRPSRCECVFIARGGASATPTKPRPSQGEPTHPSRRSSAGASRDQGAHAHQPTRLPKEHTDAQRHDASGSPRSEPA
jgi:DNA-directed RNA polymerase specialized sigma24 family protein